MKKLTVLLGAVIAAALFVFAGCSDTQTFTQKTYQSGDSRIESIAIDVSDRQLRIVASEDEQVRVEYFDSEKEYLDISVSDDNKLTVSLILDKEWTDFIGTKPSAEYRTIKVSVPDNVIVDLTAGTTNENIEVTGLSFAESVSLSSNGGSVICNRVDVGKSIALTAKNGNITGSVLGGWDDFTISCTIKKGDSNLPEYKEGGAKSFTADCNNGDIAIEFVK